MEGPLEDYLLVLIYLIVISIYLIFRIYKQQKNIEYSDELIQNYFLEKGFQVTSISKLTLTEKIKYGVDFNPFIKLYTSTFSIFTASNQSVCRSVETTDKAGNEQIRYVEVRFSGRKGIMVKEFDSYEF